jgi:hypothetical protein
VVPRGDIFLGKWRSSFAGNSEGKMNVQSACALNTWYIHLLSHASYMPSHLSHLNFVILIIFGEEYNLSYENVISENIEYPERIVNILGFIMETGASKRSKQLF